MSMTLTMTMSGLDWQCDMFCFWFLKSSTKVKQHFQFYSTSMVPVLINLLFADCPRQNESVFVMANLTQWCLEWKFMLQMNLVGINNLISVITSKELHHDIWSVVPSWHSRVLYIMTILLLVWLWQYEYDWQCHYYTMIIGHSAFFNSTVCQWCTGWVLIFVIDKNSLIGQ